MSFMNIIGGETDDFRRWLQRGQHDKIVEDVNGSGGGVGTSGGDGVPTNDPHGGGTGGDLGTAGDVPKNDPHGADPIDEGGDLEIGEETPPDGGGTPVDGDGEGGIDPFERNPFNVPDMPAPPPPPPPAPNFQGIAAAAPVYETPENAFIAEEMWNPMQQYVLDWMENPNRYLSDLATATRDEMDARLRHQEQQAQQGISEWAASKGLSGSSFEGEQMERLADQQQRAQLEEERALLEMMATAETADRQAALNAALGVGEFGRGLGADRREDAMMKAETGLRKQALMLDAAIAGDRAAMDRARHDLQVMEAMDRAALSRSELELRNEEINLRAWEAEQRLGIQDRDLALAWARHELDREKFAEAKDRWEREWERDEEWRREDIERDDERRDEDIERESEPIPGTQEARDAFYYEGWRPDGWDGWSREMRMDYAQRVLGFDRWMDRLEQMGVFDD